MLKENDKVTEALIQLINAMPERDKEKIARSLIKRKKKAVRKTITLNGVTIIPADSSVDISTLTKIFTGKNINPKQLRAKAWRRAK